MTAYSQLTTLEGSDLDDCLRVQLGSGKILDIPRRFFHTNLYNPQDVLEHDDPQMLQGIIDTFEREDLMIGEDGFIYANTQDETLSGDSYEPIGILDGDELGKGGFKFKFKMPGKKKSGKGQLVRTRSPMLRSAGNLVTKGYRTFNPIGALGKQGIIGRNLKGLKNPFKGLGKIKLGKPFKGLGKIKNPFKGGKGKGSGLMDAFTQMQEMKAEEEAARLEEEASASQEEKEEVYADEEYQDQGIDPVTPKGGYSGQPQEDYSDESSDTQEDYSDMPQEDYFDEPSEVGSSDLAFSAATTALSFIPGGNIASGLLTTGKGMYDQNAAAKKAKKDAVSQSRINFLRTLIKKNPKKKVIVASTPKQIQRVAPTPKQSSSNIPIKKLPINPVLKSSAPVFRSATDANPNDVSKKESSNMPLIIGGVAVAALLMMGGKK